MPESLKDVVAHLRTHRSRYSQPVHHGLRPYQRKRDGTYRVIQVKANAPGREHLSVRTRTGYFAPSASSHRSAKATDHEIPNSNASCAGANPKLRSLESAPAFDYRHVALGYVGFTLLNARLYQVSAKRSLESQIQTKKKSDSNPAQAAVKQGDVLGRIDIPRLGISVAVLQGTSSRTLRLGAGHIEGTPLPGETGNSGIAGHRDTFFRELKDIRKR